MRTRTLARWMGLAAGVLGLGGWLLALSVAADLSSFNLRSVIFFTAMLLAISGVAISAYRYSENGRPGWRSLLVAATLVLVLGTVLSGFTVGFLFLPAAILAIAGAVFAFFAHDARTA